MSGIRGSAVSPPNSPTIRVPASQVIGHPTMSTSTDCRVSSECWPASATQPVYVPLRTTIDVHDPPCPRTGTPDSRRMTTANYFTAAKPGWVADLVGADIV